MRIDEVSLVEMAGMPFTVCRDTDRVLVTWSTTTRVTSMTTTMMAELDARRAYDVAVEAELEELGARRDYDTILQEELEELAVRREYDGALEAGVGEIVEAVVIQTADIRDECDAKRFADGGRVVGRSGVYRTTATGGQQGQCQHGTAESGRSSLSVRPPGVAPFPPLHAPYILSRGFDHRHAWMGMPSRLL